MGKPHKSYSKKDGSWRIVGDYRWLNSVTIPDNKSIPNALDFVNICHDKIIFSTLDLERVYQQIPVAPEDVHKTAFTSPFGNYEYLVIKQGLKRASHTMRRYINEALQGCPFAFPYIDDVLVASKSPEEF